MFWFILSLCAVGVVSENNDGGVAPRLPLNDGTSIPHMGLGTWLGFNEGGLVKPKETEVEDAVTWGINAGYRLIDTASLYQDEDQVGKGVKKSGVPRKDIYIVTKLGVNEQRDVLGALRSSLKRLDMEYVDLYLIHFPVALKPDFKGFEVIDYLDTWKQMEEAKKLGLTKSIGISNFNVSQIERLLENCQVKPAVLQVEVNLNLAQDRLLSFCKEKGITVMGYTPFGSLFSKKPEPPAPRVDDPTLVAIGSKYKKTVPQIVLRYLVQRGVVPIPKSVKKERIESNINIFDFELSSEEMETLSKFNKNYRVVRPAIWQDHPYYPFERTDVVGEDLFTSPKPKNE